MASSTASEIWSAILSGWPSVTDSEVNSWRRATGISGGIGEWKTGRELTRSRPLGQAAGAAELAQVQHAAQAGGERLRHRLGAVRGQRFAGGRPGLGEGD